ncbi:helix-turn-helix domain-containing protein [Nocardia brevicatena]|uniref:helix-turn-helix domain-containing protein n=1 Tax=Nocardia brevicatena TaxID=37327 RepID=UPI00030B721B|nr:helix-turn-helix transcriptional regulator [Nocardia brevicatena]
MTQKRIGERIAEQRKLAYLTQEQLAAKMDYSVHTVRAVERGRDTPSPAFVSAAAAALGVEPELLQGTPYYETLEEDGPLEGLAELRTILAEGAYVRPVEPPNEGQLRATMSEIETAIRDDRTRRAMAMLPTLVRQLYGALHATSDEAQKRRVYGLLCNAYIVAEGACCRLGYTSLTTLVLDRLDWAATHTNDPGFAVRSLMKRARLLMSHGSTDVAMSLVKQGLGLVVGNTESERVLRGYGHLRGAMVAARARNLDLANVHIGEARRIAQPMHHESDLYTTMFGPGNVEVHACAVELEAGDPGKAARDGSALSLPTDMAAPRAGHHWQDNARAWLLAGQPDEALKSLQRARRVAPQQTRLHPNVRETLQGIAAAERRRTDSLGSFARWIGISI